tara:strand:- start:629 stop:1183 length:555 start_codon:yes stop_codon:yes gene_type:complete
MRHELFAIPVWHYNGIPEDLINDLHKGAYKFKEKYESVTRSNRGGYQTPPLDGKDFHPIGKEFVEKIIYKILEEDEWIREQSKALDHTFKIKHWEWWYNINPKGAWNIPHTHPGATLSMVLYLTDTKDLLNFHNPNDALIYGDTAFARQTKKGDILIFPSNLLHYVTPNESNEDRITVSINLQL